MTNRQFVMQPDPRGDLPRIHQYQLVRTLGRGGMGVVYEAFHVRLRRRVALKVISPQLASSQSVIDRFEREMAAIGQLSHPNIVQALDAGVDQTTHYLAMEYVDGANVESLCQQIGAMKIADACEIIRQAALGVAHAHLFGIVHRDIKPSNLLLSRDGCVKIADLGLACVRASEGVPPLTAIGAVIGTFDYMSPEQARSDEVGQASDLYSLGASLFRMLTGRPLFSGQNYRSADRKMYGHIHDLPPRLATLRPDVPPALDNLVHRLVEKNPLERLHSTENVIAVLEPLSKTAQLKSLFSSDPCPVPTDLTTKLLHSGSTKKVSEVSRPNHSIRKIQSSAAVLILMAFLLAGVLYWNRRSTIQEITTLVGISTTESDVQLRVPNAADTDPSTSLELLKSKELQMRTWYPILDREPRKVIWPFDAQSSMGFDNGRSTLNASCSGIGILSFGSVDFKEYKLRLDLYQNRWPGDVGVILGLRPHPDITGGFVAQGFLLHKLDQSEGGADLYMTRTRLVLTPMPDAEFRLTRLARRSAKLTVPAGLPETVELEVLQQGLTHLRWGGVNVPELCDPEINKTYEPADYSGDAGIFMVESDVTVSMVQFMPLSR